ncbi:MAG TPA: hypothetical protein VN750_01080, partial [Steroidobacteraceae bacterium]|nr:hypothetical protein [Steroidobacteraceae bacterium]
LSKCERIEDCQRISDWAEQIAVAAKQSRDRRAIEQAKRIMHRAKARVGELLLQIPGWLPGKGAPGHNGTIPNPNSRAQVAKRLGLAGHETHNAVALAKIDKATFNSLVETSPPPSLSHLVRIGERETVVRRCIKRGDAYQQIMNDHHGNLGHFSRWHPKHNPAILAKGLSRDEAEIIRAAIRSAMDWLDELDRRLP